MFVLSEGKLGTNFSSHEWALLKTFSRSTDYCRLWM